MYTKKKLLAADILIFFLGNMYVIKCVACIRLCFIGPCPVQQRRRSRAQIQHEGGSRVYPDHAGSACVPKPLFSEAGDKETRGVDLPLQQNNLGKAPSRPLQVHTPPLANMQIETRLGGNLTSASDSRSEAIDWARGGCGDHFGLFRASVRGQAAELETSAGQPVRFL
jgi:hypothetical protein